MGTIIRNKADLQILEQAVGENVGGRLESDAGLLDCLPVRSPFFARRRILVLEDAVEIFCQEPDAPMQLKLLQCCKIVDDHETQVFRSYVDDCLDGACG